MHLTARKVSMNSGDDVAGVVVTMGKTAAESGEFKEGDRVAGFHPMFGPGGGYAEYALVPYHTAFIIPEKTTYEGQFTHLQKQDSLLTRHRSCDHPPCHDDRWSLPLPPSKGPPNSMVSTRR
jgi:prephenate dehydrogenase